jgi:hypothetical protein
MKIENINSTNFQAAFRFANTKPTPPTIKDMLCDKMTHPCKQALSCTTKGIVGIWLLGPIVKRIAKIKNSIKNPS